MAQAVNPSWVSGGALIHFSSFWCSQKLWEMDNMSAATPFPVLSIHYHFFNYSSISVNISPLILLSLPRFLPWEGSIHFYRLTPHFYGCKGGRNQAWKHHPFPTLRPRLLRPGNSPGIKALDRMRHQEKWRVMIGLLPQMDTVQIGDSCRLPLSLLVDWSPHQSSLPLMACCFGVISLDYFRGRGRKNWWSHVYKAPTGVRSNMNPGSCHSFILIMLLREVASGILCVRLEMEKPRHRVFQYCSVLCSSHLDMMVLRRAMGNLGVWTHL